MNTKIYLKSTAGLFNAEGEYDDGTVIVRKGSKIQTKLASHTHGGEAKTKALRENRSIVDANGVVLENCSFSSPSTAANFVTGRSSNGYVAWRVDDKNNLGKFLGREKKKGSKQSY